MHCDVNTKLRNDTGDFETTKYGCLQLYTYLKKYRGYQKGIRHREKICSSKIAEIIHAIYQDFSPKMFIFL